MSFDWLISPHRSFRSALIGYLAKIPNRWGFTNSEGNFLFTHLIKYRKNLYDLERNLYFLEDFCDDPMKLETKIEFSFNNLIETETEDVLAKKGWCGEKIIGVHTGSKWFTKKWPVEKFKKLLRILVEKNYKILVFGDDDDFEINNFLEFELVSENVLNMIGKTNIKQLLSYFRKLSVYLTNDSGPMHIAAALGVPIVAIFGPTVKELGFFPYTEKAQILEIDLVCRPCGKHGGKVCPKNNFKCMEDISVENVVLAVEKFYE
jgi:heptosyltransferase-2